MSRTFDPYGDAPLARPGPSFTERFWGLRDRILGSARAQRFLARFPLTRGVARRKARALYDIAAGFVYSQTLLACVRADLFEALAEGPVDLSEIAAQARLCEDSARRLADAAVSLDLLAKRGPRAYGLGELGAALRGNPGVTAMVEHNAVFYQDISNPLALLRGEGGTTRLSRFWPYAGEAGSDDPDAASVADYGALMASSQAFIADDVLDAVSLKGRRLLLDIGGGEGAFLMAALARWPRLSGAVFDLPAVAERADAAFRDQGFAERARGYGGDARRGEAPVRADAVSLVRVLHDHEDAAARDFLKTAYAALEPGGSLIVAEPMADAAGPAGAAYFGFYLAAMGQGRARTVADIARMVREAGFESVATPRVGRPMLASLVTARRGRGSA